MTTEDKERIEKESHADIFKKREEDIVNKFISEIEDKHFLEELGGNWKVKEEMQEEFAVCEEMKDLIEDAIDALSFFESEHERAQQELQAYRDIIKELIPIAQWGYDLLVPFDKNGMGKDWPSTIQEAKKLIDTVTPT